METSKQQERYSGSGRLSEWGENHVINASFFHPMVNLIMAYIELSPTEHNGVYSGTNKQ